MNELSQQMELLCQIGRLAYSKGMVTGSGGNLSFRSGEGMYITPHAITLDSIRPQDLLYLPFDRTYEGQREPSVEWKLHLACYCKRPDVNAIVHLHSYYSVIAGILAPEGGPVMSAYTGSYACKVGTVGLVGLYKSGDDEMIAKVVRELERANVVLMKNHGIIACGADLRGAFSLCEDTEYNARFHVQLQGIGALTQAQISALG